MIRNAVSNHTKKQLDFYDYQCQKQNFSEACIYGKVLTLLSLNQFEQAELILTPLLINAPNNLFYQFAMADAEIGEKHYHQAIKRLHDVQIDYPDNYAALINYAQSLRAGSQSETAVKLLLKGFRQFKHDLPLCEILAQTQAEAHQKGYAYLTQSQCYLLQGRRFDALRQLEQAKLFAN